jgi:hypothetical protein
MSDNGQIRHGNTSVHWDEERNELYFDLNPATAQFFLNYDRGRELLDCLMVIFGKTELTYRYPEVR